jgi:predicted ABC-type transport system involved in lysophospholipase L1 biosynthesis ATPase subunit
MARSALEEREYHVLEGHWTDPTGVWPQSVDLIETVTPVTVRQTGRFRCLIHYLGRADIGHYGDMVESGPPGKGGGSPVGAELRITAGLSLDVPPGQSLALLSQPREVSVELLDVVAGLKPLNPSRRRSGSARSSGAPASGAPASGAYPGGVLVDGVAVDQLRGPALDRYRASRGLLSTRFPLLATRSVLDNVLAALPSGKVDARARGRAVALLRLTGATDLPAPPQEAPVQALTAEQQWRVLIARALLPAPRLVLAEDPAAGGQAPGLEGRAATAIWDLLTDMHALFGFTLLVAASRTVTAIRCQRIVTLSGWTVTGDELTGGDDPWTRGRVDRIG